MEAGLKTALFKVGGMSCHHCVAAVRRELEKMPVQVIDVQLGRVEVEYDETKVSETQLRHTIEYAGYQVL